MRWPVAAVDGPGHPVDDPPDRLPVEQRLDFCRLVGNRASCICTVGPDGACQFSEPVIGGLAAGGRPSVSHGRSAVWPSFPAGYKW
jgi:hypothetical protein